MENFKMKIFLNLILFMLFIYQNKTNFEILYSSYIYYI